MAIDNSEIIIGISSSLPSSKAPLMESLYTSKKPYSIGMSIKNIILNTTYFNCFLNTNNIIWKIENRAATTTVAANDKIQSIIKCGVASLLINKTSWLTMSLTIASVIMKINGEMKNENCSTRYSLSCIILIFALPPQKCTGLRCRVSSSSFRGHRFPSAQFRRTVPSVPF